MSFGRRSWWVLVDDLRTAGRNPGALALFLPMAALGNDERTWDAAVQRGQDGLIRSG